MNAHAAAQMTAYPRSLDPQDFREETALAGLMLRMQRAGVAQRDFVDWAQGNSKQVNVAWQRLRKAARQNGARQRRLP